MNRIEDEWLHFQRDRFACRVFEDEYELAIAIIEGIENRAAQGHYQLDIILGATQGLTGRLVLIGGVIGKILNDENESKSNNYRVDNCSSVKFGNHPIT